MMNLPSYIIKALSDGKTSLGQHPSFPPEEEEAFSVGIVNNFFEQLTKDIDNTNIEDLKSQLSEALTDCKKIESKHIDELEKLCADTVNEIFNIPDDTLKIEMNIVNSIDARDERLVPEKTVDFTFDDIEDMSRLTDEVYKRRMLNSLVAGASMAFSENISSYIRGLFEIDSELPSLYKKIFKLNNILLYLEKDSFNKDNMTDAGKVDVNISSPMNIVEIKAQGVLMPILLEETIKGILELAISHGLPKNAAKAQYVISKSDFKLAEMWDMRLGLPLWNLISQVLEEQGVEIEKVGANYLLMQIAKLDVNEFNYTLKEIFKQTRRGKQILSDIANSIIEKKEEEDFSNYMNDKNSETELIGDEEYYNPDELIADSIMMGESESHNKVVRNDKKKVDEVRYINPSVRNGGLNKPQRANFYDVYKQDTIKNDETIRAFHGCSIDTALNICNNGTSGKVYHPRTYSYESGMNPLGIFVTVDFEQAKKFGYHPNTMCIIEFTAKASDLEAPIWNGQDTYFVQGSNPQPFRNAEERKAQKDRYDNNARNIKDDDYWDYSKNSLEKIDKSYIRNSDKPSLASSIFDDTEHQALFMGDLNPNMIKNVWVCKNSEKQYKKYSRKDFVRLFSKKTIKKNGKLSKYSKKLFSPNDNVSSYKDILNRILDLYSDEHMSREQLYSHLNDIGLSDNPPTSDTAINYLGRNLWPKQIIQAYGKDFFNKYFNRLEQDF